MPDSQPGYADATFSELFFFLRSEAEEGALYIRDCPEYNVCRNILAKS